MNVKRDLSVIRKAWHTRRFYQQAQRLGLPGAHFYGFGRSLGWKAWFRQRNMKPTLLYTPVNITRYYEFDFIERMLKREPLPLSRALDLSSPFLFSLYAAKNQWVKQIHLCNPDAKDLKLSRFYANTLGRKSIVFTEGTEEAVSAADSKEFDVIWSISVVEHILTETGDERDTLQRLWRMLKPGGLLILTVPVDSEAWDEYRNHDSYGTQLTTDQGYFFQRFYDDKTIQNRLITAVGVEPEVIEWFGEKQQGHFHTYIKKWLKEGEEVTRQDPLDISRNYQRYATFAEMPGAGVCGLCFRKPSEEKHHPVVGRV